MISHKVNSLSFLDQLGQNPFSYSLVSRSTTPSKLKITAKNLSIIRMAASSSSTPEQPLCRLFALADIQSATGGFSEEHVIGRGGFGKVYKALIDGGSTPLAVKRLASNSNQGEREFAMEMETLTKVRHRNLVSLIGYCREEGEMFLVYEYMANGTLADHLYVKLPADIEPLSWDRRLRICIGAGRGLDYLHYGCSIIHRDVKSTNILLDDSFRAKVSDLGLAKHLGGDESVSHVSASVKGSFGYFDPSYFTTGRLTRGSDVYAFGVVLLEVLSGRSPLDRWMADEGYLCMSMWAQEKIRGVKADQIVAPDLRGEISDSCLKTFVGVAKRCLHHEPKKRITMTQAVVQLELALEQQESRRTTTNQLQFWPFRSRAIASGSTQTDAVIEQFYKKSEESEVSFIEQVSKVSRMQHENFVQLLGYCTDGLMRALLFEFGSRRSLHAVLHEPEPCPALSWPRRIKIAVGVARELCYIHDNNLIHRNVRSSNVLLFNNEIAKITHPPPKIPCSCKRSKFDYDDPYAHETGCGTDHLTVKDDVYSFGLVLLELLTGTQLFGCTWELQQEYVSWAKVRLFQDRVQEVVDPRLEADYPLDPVEKMGAIAKLCLHYDVHLRPDMSTVSQALQIASQETHLYYSHKKSLSQND